MSTFDSADPTAVLVFLCGNDEHASVYEKFQEKISRGRFWLYCVLLLEITIDLSKPTQTDQQQSKHFTLLRLEGAHPESSLADSLVLRRIRSFRPKVPETGIFIIPNLPEKNKFVGGAEQARKNARRRQQRPVGKRVEAPQTTAPVVLSLRIHAFDRFFACMLLQPAKDYLSAVNTEDELHTSLIERICARAGVPVVTTPLSVSYNDVASHAAVRTSLVLEEARHALSAAMETIWKNERNLKKGSMVLQLKAVEQQGKLIRKCTFHNPRRFFSKTELFSIRPGTVVQLATSQSVKNVDMSQILLGVITAGNRETIEHERTFSVSCYGPLPQKILVETNNDGPTTEWHVTALATLVAECRSFEALTMTLPQQQLAFFPTLVSGRLPQRTRFDSDGNEMVESISPHNVADEIAFTLGDNENAHFTLRPLNPIQEEAASAFLQAKPGTITLVQGPPGTGKTTLLVSVISRLLLKAKSDGEDYYRVLVCAPTNKAISVLATRFLHSMTDNTFTPILVGDVDKLLSDEKFEKYGRLHSIFLYTWMQSVIESYNRIKVAFMHGVRDTAQRENLDRTSHELRDRISKSLPDVPETVRQRTEVICTAVRDGVRNQSIAVNEITLLIKELNALPTDQVNAQLLRSADVIFCTLVSSGASFLKRTDPVCDLIVEEAAAATEPELYIPFHLQPSRLLAVGDPKQLPATVLSQRAAQFGLAKSLHERLMFDCNYPHVMLDIQYRMSCQISRFPSQRFYDSKIGNGMHVASPCYLEGPVFLDKIPYIFHQIDGKEEQSSIGSYFNQAEAMAIVNLISRLQQMGTPPHTSSLAWDSSDRIRVITFYQAQVVLIKRLLSERGLANRITVATVDSSQGCEADLVIISFVRSPSFSNARPSAGFLTDDRRMNVALTRARFQLVCVGNVRAYHRFCRRAETLHELAEDAHNRGVIRTPMFL